MNPEKLKTELTHRLNYYSKYHCRQFIECEELFENQKGHLSIFYLFSLLENVIKSTLNDFDSTSFTLIQQLNNTSIINKKETDFLNSQSNGIRRLRNIFAHANLSKFDLKINDQQVTYPLIENETCLLLYEMVSPIISGIILKVLDPILENDDNLDMTVLINLLDYEIIERSPEQLLEFKGMSAELFNGWEELDESTKYRLVENSPSADILSGILRNLNL